MNPLSLTGSRRAAPSSPWLRQFLGQALALLMVAALALSSLGPMIDHHYAERHPGHGHLFFGAADVSHSHDFDGSHDHYGAWMYYPAQGKSTGAQSPGIAYFMPLDGSGSSSADIASPVVKKSLLLAGGDDTGLLAPASGVTASLTGATVSPLKRPPRA